MPHAEQSQVAVLVHVESQDSTGWPTSLSGDTRLAGQFGEMAGTVITKQIIVCGVAGMVPGCAVEQVKVAIVVQVREAGAVGPSIEVCDSAPFSVFDKQPSVDVVKEQIGHRLAENHGDIQIGKSVGIDVGKQDSMTTCVRTGRATGASLVGDVGEMRFAALGVLLGKGCHTHRQANQME